MRENRQYTLSWDWLQGTQVRCDSCDEPLRVDGRYRGLFGMVAGIIGWGIGYVIDSILNVGNSALGFLIMLFCMMALFWLAYYAFHLFLCVQNKRGRLSKYLE